MKIFVSQYMFALLLYQALTTDSFRRFSLLSGVICAYLVPHSTAKSQYSTLLSPSTPTKGLKAFVSEDYFEEQNMHKPCLPFNYVPPTSKQSFWTQCALWFQFPWRRVPQRAFLKMSLGGSLSIQEDSFSFHALLDKESVSTLPALTQLCLLGAHDPRVEGLYIELSPLTCGYAKLDEALRWIEYFRQSGKPVIGYATRASEKEVYLSRGFSEFYLPPLGNNMDLRGFSVSATFWRGILHKIGIEPQVQRIGKYKSFGDVYLRESMSDAQREVMTQLLYQESAHWLRNIIETNRNTSDVCPTKTDIDDFQAWLWSNTTVKDTIDYVRHRHFPLLTGVLYHAQLENMIHTRFGTMKQLPWWKRWFHRRRKDSTKSTSDVRKTEELDVYQHTRRCLQKESLNSDDNAKCVSTPSDRTRSETSPKVTFFGANSYLSCMKNTGTHLLPGTPVVITSNGPRIAIVSLSGTITEDSSSFSTNEINSASLETFIDTLMDDDDVEGVVLYIDSPGGSADASDILWHKLRELAMRKPLVACLSDVAASGGYYLAMACDQIVAEEMTLTGSIGVVLGKMNFEELLEKKLGIKRETLSIGKYAELSSTSKRFNKDEAHYFELLAKKMYQSFVDKAAMSRGMNVSQMEKFAQGRVWTGQNALVHGLIDHLGGLWTAVDIADRLVKQEKQRRNTSPHMENTNTTSIKRPYRVELTSEYSNTLKNWLFGSFATGRLNKKSSLHPLYLAPKEVITNDLCGISRNFYPYYDSELIGFDFISRDVSIGLAKKLVLISRRKINFIRELSFFRNRYF